MTIRTIMFHISHYSSHLNASFKLAKTLKNKGYRIVYFNFPHTKEIIESQGLEFFPFPQSHFFAHINRSNSTIKRKLTIYKNILHYQKEFLKGDFYDELLKLTGPKLVVVDLSLIYYSVFLIPKNIPFVIICTKLSLSRSDDVAPFTCDYIPTSSSWKNTLYLNYLWERQVLKNRINNFIHNIRYDKASHHHLAMKYLKSCGFKTKSLINTQRSSHFGYKTFPEIILSPRYFDIKRGFPNNQIHMGPIVDLDRKEVGYDSHFPDIMERIEKRIDGKQIKLVYCALGNCTLEYIKNRVSFYLKVINVLVKKENTILILATGNNIEPRAFKFQADNVFVFKNVPQLKILKKADMMINHGGMQSVTECIMLGVPMLTYPLSHQRFDQTGNSARVEFHKIGLKGNIKKDSEKDIHRKINEILETPSYVKNIEAMKDKLADCKDFEKGISFIEKYLKQSQ